MKLKQNAIETNYNPSQDDKFLKTIGGLFLSRQVCQRLTFIHFTSLRGSIDKMNKPIAKLRKKGDRYSY